MLCYGYGYFDKIFRGLILELVTALRQIGKTLTPGGQPFEVGDACNQPGTLHDMNLLKQDPKTNSTIICSCTLILNNDSYCHITSL